MSAVGAYAPRADERRNHIATTEARINDRIRAREVLLVDPDGEQLGVKPLPEALAIARELRARPGRGGAQRQPARVPDHGLRPVQVREEQRAKESRRKTTNVVIKEMKFRPKIGRHDYDTKMKHVERFLDEGTRSSSRSCSVAARWPTPSSGCGSCDRVAEEVADVRDSRGSPELDGRNMTMVLAPDKGPEAAAEGRRRTASTVARTQPDGAGARDVRGRRSQPTPQTDRR